MAIPMTTLRRAPNGEWYSRKGIPADVRESYGAAFGRSREEFFRCPPGLPVGAAKQALREWDAAITSRIEALRAAKRGEGQALTHREAHALAGEWYLWFVARHEDEPGEAKDWELASGRLEEAYTSFKGAEIDPDAPVVRRLVRAELASSGYVPVFLAERGVVLSPEAMDRFLDATEDEFIAALAALRRRTGGDYKRDKRVERFPEFKLAKTSGLTCWGLFEAWVKERKPGASTVNRWRSVFLNLQARFGDRDIATITEDEAREWKDTLLTPERSPQVANEDWLRAARVAFGWAKDNKKVSTNPFEGVSIAAPPAPPKVREREFTDEEWQTILRATLEPPPARMSGYNAAARRWVPWLCAYTGSRPGEVTQLRGEDIRRDKGGFWTMRITPEAGTVKGDKARVVPLHDHLLEQGFPAFVEAHGPGPLFYDPEAQRAKRDDPTNPARPGYVKARDKLSEWTRALGVSDPNISPTHAWRHTFKRRAARAGIERRIRFAMCGHASNDVGDEYETPTVADLAAEMIRFPRYEV